MIVKHHFSIWKLSHFEHCHKAYAWTQKHISIPMPPPSLTRRQALQAAGSSLILTMAGCSTFADDRTESAETPDRTAISEQPPTTTATRTSTPTSPSETPTVELSPVTTDDVGVDVEVLQSFTDDHPARITVAVENVSEQQFSVDGSLITPFPLYSDEQADGHPKLIFVPEETKYLGPEQEDAQLVPDAPSDGCWAVGYDVVIKPIGITANPSPGDTTAMTYTILEYKTEACLPPDTYHVVYPHRVSPVDPGHERRDEMTVELLLGFTLTIAEDGSVSVPRTVVRRLNRDSSLGD